MATKTTPLIAEAVDRYLESRYDLTPVSLRTYRNTLKRFAAYQPVKQVGRLTADDMEGFLLALRRGDRRAGGTKPLSDTSLRHVITTLEGFLDYCHRKGWSRGDLLANTKKPTPTPRRDYLQLTPDELLRALDMTDDPRDRVCIATAMNTGLRSNEMKLLKLGHVDLDNGFMFTAIPKGRVTDRMPINLDFEGEIHRWLNAYGAECGQLDSSWHLIPSRHRPVMGGRNTITRGPLNPHRPFHDAGQIAHRALLRLGYSHERIAYEGMHTFRRSVARIYFDAAASGGGYDSALRETAALLHHKSTATTELYLGLNSDTERRNVRLKGKPFLSALASDVGNIRKIG